MNGNESVNLKQSDESMDIKLFLMYAQQQLTSSFLKIYIKTRKNV